MGHKRKQKEPRNWHAVNAHFRKSGAMDDKQKQEERDACRKWQFNEAEEVMEELLVILKTMDVPKNRLQDVPWLSRNLGIRNGSHPDFKEAMRMIKKLLKFNRLEK